MTTGPPALPIAGHRTRFGRESERCHPEGAPEEGHGHGHGDEETRSYAH